MRTPTLGGVMAAIFLKGYEVLEGPDDRAFNLVGVRSSDPRSNAFDDFLTVFYPLKKEWIFFAFPATTDPGTYYRENPMNVRGTAVLKPGQYDDVYTIGKHKGRPALVQTGNLTVYRDANRDDMVDEASEEQTGLFGINIHRARQGGASHQVDKWSAGCTVVQDSRHMDFLLALCKQAAGKDIRFSYTLLRESELVE